MSRFDSQSMSVPATPKIGPVSLPDPDSPTDASDFKPRKRRLSFLAKLKGGGVASRSTTPAPVPVSRYEHPPPGPSQRPRASSMTGRTREDPKLKHTMNAVAPRYSEPLRASSQHHHRQVSAPQSTPWLPPANVHLRKHQGRETPKYMKATVKEVAIKEESVVLSWPLVPMDDRAHLKYPLLYYDIAFDPQDDQSVKDNRHAPHFLSLPKADRELPVSTHCKITEMVIECPLVGSLVVARPEGLRCLDVWFAIYSKYQKKPKGNEWPVDIHRDKYRAAFEQRCHDAPGITEYNRRCGLLRVDLLQGHRIFDGLRRVNGRWELYIDKIHPSRTY